MFPKNLENNIKFYFKMLEASFGLTLRVILLYLYLTKKENAE